MFLREEQIKPVGPSALLAVWLWVTYLPSLANPGVASLHRGLLQGVRADCQTHCLTPGVWGAVRAGQVSLSCTVGLGALRRGGVFWCRRSREA